VAQRNDDLTDGLDFLIRDTRLRLYKHLERAIAGEGIPIRFWFALRALDRHPGITQRELGLLLGFGDARAGVVVAAMSRRRLVARRTSTSDKRKIELYLTPFGKSLARRNVRLARAAQQKMLTGLTSAETTTFRRLLERVHANLRA
jgi:MarR family transcriptional regulator, organic hydroperoxide resistance regulator